MHHKKPAVVACPQCGKEVVWQSEISPYRPFCSERCKLIDLGKWAEGGYSIPLENPPEDEMTDDDHTKDNHQA